MKALKVLNIIAVVTSIVSAVISIIQKDWTEAGAWLIVTLYNTQNLVNNLLDETK